MTGSWPPLDLLVLGDINPDLILSGDRVEPEFGQVERLIDDAQLLIGGSAAITACGAAALGLRTAIVGVVGDDLYGDCMRESLAARGVDVSGVHVSSELSTGLTVVLAKPDDRAMLTYPGSIASLRADHVDRDLLRAARHVHVASVFLQVELAPELPALLEQVRASGAATSLDPNWDPSGGWDGGLRGALRHVDLFLPNAGEGERIGGTAAQPSLAQALALLDEVGAR